jgi:RNA polymerase sigma factor (sigma-70 family)
MADDNSFANLVSRVRAGNAQAAEELVRRYEQHIRRAVRIRLRDTRLTRVLESVDVCQEVLASFFVRAGLGQYELNQPEELIGLLVTRARNKLTDHVRRQQAECRDNRRQAAFNPGDVDLAASGPTPSMQVAMSEALQEARRRLAPEELQLLQLQEEGCTWAEIAERLGGTGEGRRKQLARAVERVAEELGLQE